MAFHIAIAIALNFCGLMFARSLPEEKRDAHTAYHVGLFIITISTALAVIIVEAFA